jgi:DNA-binding transcriptional LysR family regulator
MLDVRRLHVLRTVAEVGSFSGAAEALSFTQPAISRQIATLEAEAGAQLVERNARGIRLTAAGQLLVEHADVILDRLAVAQTQLDALAGLSGGRVRLGAFPTANATLIPLAIKRFDDTYPDVDLQLDEAVSGDLVDRLKAAEIDLAVVADPPLEDPELELTHLMDDPLHLALPLGHRLAGAGRVAMADLADETWIEGRHPSAAEPLRNAARIAGFEPRICFESTQWLGKQGLVAAGLGVTLIPSLALATVREDVVLRSLGKDAPTRRIFVATLCCGYRNPAIAPMAALLREVAEQHCFSCDAKVL